MKCATPLKSQGVISEDIVLMFNEMYLQKCEECSGGEIIGANEDSLKTLKNCCFRVREIVSDNPSASVLAYKLLLKESGHLDDHLFIQHNYQKIYWLHDAVHLIKNVRNNLLNYKRFIFPAFEYDGFKDTILFKPT